MKVKNKDEIFTIELEFLEAQYLSQFLDDFAHKQSTSSIQDKKAMKKQKTILKLETKLFKELNKYWSKNEQAI